MEASNRTRRSLFGLGIGAAALVGGVTSACSETPAATVAPPAVSADQAWQSLIDGNDRFVNGKQQHPHETLQWREALVKAQHPFAAILGCADSRVTPEVVFDEGLGDLFTIRAAGEVLDSSVIGSIEYAVENLGVPLVVVLGHAGCGAVSATIEVVQGRATASGDISTLVRSIEAAVRATPNSADAAGFLNSCVAEQARRSARQLQERSAIVGNAIASRSLKVVAATYDLTSGKVAQLT